MRLSPFTYVEFQEREWRFTCQSLLYRFEGKHTIDGKMGAVVAQKVQVFDFRQPLVVIDHDGVRGFLVSKLEKLFKYLANSVRILLNDFIRQQDTRFVLAGRIAHLAGTTANQDHWLVSRLLQVTENHNLQQTPDM